MRFFFFFVNQGGSLSSTIKADEYSLISNSNKLSLNFHYTTDKRLDTLNFCSNDIENIMQNLDPNKTHGHYKISTRMVKICGRSICKLLQLIFNQCINIGFFPLK